MCFTYYDSLEDILHDISTREFNNNMPYHFSLLIDTVSKTIEHEYDFSAIKADTIAKYWYFVGVNPLDYLDKVMSFCYLYKKLESQQELED